MFVSNNRPHISRRFPETGDPATTDGIKEGVFSAESLVSRTLSVLVQLFKVLPYQSQNDNEHRPLTFGRMLYECPLC
jgi:hypothetical protein